MGGRGGFLYIDASLIPSSSLNTDTLSFTSLSFASNEAWKAPDIFILCSDVSQIQSISLADAVLTSTQSGDGGIVCLQYGMDITSDASYIHLLALD